MIRTVAWIAWRLGKAFASGAYWIGTLVLVVWAAGATPVPAGGSLILAGIVGILAFALFAALSLEGRKIEGRLAGGPPSPDPLRPSFGLYLLKTLPIAIYWAIAMFFAFALFFGDPIGGYTPEAERAMLRLHASYMTGSVALYALLSWLWNRVAERRG